MESEARYTLVGAVLLALAAATVGAVIWLARSGSQNDFHFFTIYFERQSLDGLQVGADVTMRGIKVGRVDGYDIPAENINRVQVDVRVDRDTPVSQNTTAVVQRNLVTGLARIALVTPGQPGPPLTTVRAGERFPVIPEGQSNLDHLTDVASKLAMSGSQVLDNLNATLSPDNRAALTATLANLRDLSAGLASRVDRIDTTVASLNNATAEIARASHAVATAVAALQRDAQPVATQVEVTLREATRAIERLEREAATVGRRIDGAAEVSTLEIRATAQELRESAAILARAVDRLRDPRSALLGPSREQLGPGERLQ